MSDPPAGVTGGEVQVLLLLLASPPVKFSENGFEETKEIRAARVLLLLLVSPPPPYDACFENGLKSLAAHGGAVRILLVMPSFPPLLAYLESGFVNISAIGAVRAMLSPPPPLKFLAKGFLEFVVDGDEAGSRSGVTKGFLDVEAVAGDSLSFSQKFLSNGLVDFSVVVPETSSRSDFADELLGLVLDDESLSFSPWGPVSVFAEIAVDGLLSSTVGTTNGFFDVDVADEVLFSELAAWPREVEVDGWLPPRLGFAKKVSLGLDVVDLSLSTWGVVPGVLFGEVGVAVSMLSNSGFSKPIAGVDESLFSLLVIVKGRIRSVFGLGGCLLESSWSPPSP